MTKKYILDYWNDKEIILALSDSDKDLFAIGEKINGGEKYIHINLKELLLFLKEQGVKK